MSVKLYKIVSTKFESIHGGSGLWFAPTQTKPGKWMPKVDDVVACQSGYHLVPAKAIVDWLPPSSISGYLCEAEGRGASDKDGNKIAFAQARLLKIVGVLDEVSIRLSAADIAERVLPIFYKVQPMDDRPAKAIQAARDYASGKIDDTALATAWNAAKDAALSVTKSAVTWDAASTAWSAAWSTVWSVSRKTMTKAAILSAANAAWIAADAVKRISVDGARAAGARTIIKQAKKRYAVLQG